MQKGKMQEIQQSVLTPEILTIVHGLNVRFDKPYCFPSQNKILELMEDIHTVVRARSTLNRHLRIIEDLGIIIRTRRIRRDPRKGMIFKSTLYKITLKGYEYLRRLGVNVWKQINILKSIMKKRNEWPDLAEKKGRVKSDLIPLKDILGGFRQPKFI